MVISFESRKKSYPAYIVPAAYAVFALFFPDRWRYCAALLLALTLFLGSYGLGKRLCFLILKTADQSLYFPAGLGMVFAICFGVAQFTLGPIFFYGVWILLGILSFFELPVLTYRFNRNYLWAVPFVLLAFWSCFTPVTDGDTLAQHLGLAQQSLAIGKMQVIPNQLSSSFPPFGQVLFLLFAGVGMLSGIKAFLLVVYFQLLFILTSLLRWLVTEPMIAGGNGKDQESSLDLMYLLRTELLVVPLLFLPGVWILLHLAWPDLLAALFLCAGVATIVKEFDFLTPRKIFNAALFLSFALWTQYSVLLYVAALFVLWLSLSRGYVSRESWKRLGLLFGITIFLWTPFLIRNATALGDPIYPVLSGILENPTWSPAQALALERDLMPEGGGIGEIFLAPVKLTFRHAEYGKGAALGLVPLVSLLLYPFARKLRVVNQILIYLLVCFLLWLFIFHQFRNFLAAFFLFSPAAYFSFRYLYLYSAKHLFLSWIACGSACLLFLFPVFGVSYPLIRLNQTNVEYLRENLDYFPLVETLGRVSDTEKILMLGEFRIAYYRSPVIASGKYDQVPLRRSILEATNSQDLMRQFRKEKIRFIVYDETGFENSYGKEGRMPLPEPQFQLLKAFLASSARVVRQSGNLVLFELEDRLAW
jgi:hypothetical protein